MDWSCEASLAVGGGVHSGACEHRDGGGDENQRQPRDIGGRGSGKAVRGRQRQPGQGCNGCRCINDAAIRSRTSAASIAVLMVDVASSWI